MKTGPQTAFTVEAQRGKNADGTLSSSKFYLMYPNGDYMEYEKKEATLLPDGQQLPARLDVRGHIRSDNAAQSGQNRSGHQTTSLYTTPPRNSPDFKVPIRIEGIGFGPGQPRVVLNWDGQHEIIATPTHKLGGGGLFHFIPQVALVEELHNGTLNGLKYLANYYFDGSPAPRYFYLRNNKRDGTITIYGNDDIDKLRALEKGKAR
jgi:hypothetical protein